MIYITNFLKNKEIVKHSPLIAMILLEVGNATQIYRIWTEWTAKGQSLWGWIMVHLALWIWYNWYLVFTPDQKQAKFATAVGIFLSAVISLSIIYFRLFYD